MPTEVVGGVIEGLVGSTGLGVPGAVIEALVASSGLMIVGGVIEALVGPDIPAAPVSIGGQIMREDAILSSRVNRGNSIMG